MKNLKTTGGVSEVHVVSDEDVTIKKQTPAPKTFAEEYREFLKAKAIKRMAHKQLKSTKIGRNDPCPCNSGKKYKKCCLIY